MFYGGISTPPLESQMVGRGLDHRFEGGQKAIRLNAWGLCDYEVNGCWVDELVYSHRDHSAGNRDK